MIEKTVIEEAFCDLTGHALGESGWAIVRRSDRREVAHFGGLNDLADFGPDLNRIAWAEATRRDDEEAW